MPASNVVQRLIEELQAGRFVDVTELAVQLKKKVAAELASTSTSVERDLLRTNVLQDLEQILQLARVVRSHIAAHLAAVNNDLVYRSLYQVPFSGDHSWEVSG